MKKVIALLLCMTLFAGLCTFAFADDITTVVGNDGDTYYLYYLGSDVWVTSSGIKFYMSGVKGEFVSEYGYYFHDGTYKKGTGHESMEGVTTKVTGNDGDVYYIRNYSGNTWCNYNGVMFYKTSVKGEFVSEFGYYFHDATYVRGTGHDTMK